MTDTNHTVSLPFVLANLRRHRLLIVLTIFLAVVGSVVFSSFLDTKYKAEAVIAFNDESADLQALGTPASPNFQPDKLAAAQAERITRPDLIARVRLLSRSSLTPSEIQDSVETQVDAASNLVKITVEAATGETAAALANGFAKAIRQDTKERSAARYRAAAKVSARRARQYPGRNNIARRALYEDQVSRLQTLASLTRPVDVVRSAEVPSKPSSPKPVRNAILAALLGLILGVGIAFLRQTLDRRLREQADVESYLGMPTVGLIPTSALGGTPLADTKGKTPNERDVEPFKILRNNVGFLSLDSEVSIVLVTSALPEEGKSTVATGLAWAEAKAGKRTLLVDCDLRRPTVAGRLGVPPDPGLADYLLGDAEPSDVLRVVSLPEDVEAGGSEHFACIPAGRSVPNHAELLGSDRFRLFLEQVSKVYDRVILDSAPLLPVSDTLALLPHMQGMLLCVRLEQTTRDEVLSAKAALEHFRDKPMGVVLTAGDTRGRPYYVGSYAYDRVAQEVS